MRPSMNFMGALATANYKTQNLTHPLLCKA